MQTPRLKSILCSNPQGLHRMAYWEWGDPDNDQVLLCVHGLTRTGRDFDEVAKAMSATHRVICPDVVGRGESDRHQNPLYYAIPFYVADMTTLIACLGAKTIDYLGTSMGGIIGMMMMGSHTFLRRSHDPLSLLPSICTPLFRRMILNDVGPQIEPVSLERICDYVGKPVHYDSFEEAVTTLKHKAASFGPMSDQHWEDFARAGLRQVEGKWVPNYDLAIAENFTGLLNPEALKNSETVLWSHYDCIDVPLFIIHGEKSDLLSTEGVEQMLARHPLAKAVDIPDTGHAPALLEQDQVKLVCDFFHEE